MKLAHLSDLHLGKRVNGFSLIPDQAYILDQICRLLDAEKPDALLLAGDIYDKSIPSSEAVELLDAFLVRLSNMGLPVYAISGNHDSPERLAFGRRLIAPSGIHLSPVYDGTAQHFTLEDAHGQVNIWLLPFLKYTQVRKLFPDEEISCDNDALRAAVQAMHIDPQQRNILVCHQFVTGAERCDSEEASVGGSDNVDASLFSDFDYVALGHLHGPQTMDGFIRYSGSILKYSFSECDHQKSITIAELGEKGNLQIRTAPLTPLHDMRQIRGSYEEITALSYYQDTAWKDDYLRIILTDEEDIPQAVSRLRLIYPNLMRLDYDNQRTRAGSPIIESEMTPQSPMALFGALYEMQNGVPLQPDQTGYLTALMEAIQEEMQ